MATAERAALTAPRNTLKREQRVARWNAAAAESRAFRPQPITGKGARAKWYAAVFSRAGDLSGIVRLVGFALADTGNPDGSRIFPGTRLLAEKCNLSQRVVCGSINTLVRRGFLVREWRVGNAAGAGFRYVLTIPEVLTEGAHLNGEGADAECAPLEVSTQRAHGEHSGADTCALSRTEVSTQRQPTRSYPLSTRLRTPAPAGRTADGRAPQEPETEDERLRRLVWARLRDGKPDEEIVAELADQGVTAEQVANVRRLRETMPLLGGGRRRQPETPK